MFLVLFKILIVEDNFFFVFELEMFLDEMGYIDILCVDYFGIVFDYIYS